MKSSKMIQTVLTVTYIHGLSQCLYHNSPHDMNFTSYVARFISLANGAVSSSIKSRTVGQLLLHKKVLRREKLQRYLMMETSNVELLNSLSLPDRRRQTVPFSDDFMIN